MNWEECTRLAYAKKIEPDINHANSIIESAKYREKTAGMLPVNDSTKETVYVLYYDVLRDLISALAIQKGYKIYNHECLASFLNEIIKDVSSAREFDHLRRLRNKINYEGKKLIGPNEAIERAKNLIAKFKPKA
jgi:hypothetical protein